MKPYGVIKSTVKRQAKEYQMSWWVWLIIIVVVLSFFGKKRKPSKKKAIGKKRRPANNKAKSLIGGKSAKDIASEVTTLAHFRALEKKVERGDEKLMEGDFGEKAYEGAAAKIQILQDALGIAESKTFRCQFIPSFLHQDIETPLYEAKRAYKVFPIAEYEEKVREFGSNKNDWIELSAYDEPEEIDDEIKFIIKFRTIVENTELSEEEISKKINALVSRNAEQAIEFFDIESDIKPAEQWRIKDKYT
jgi:Sec-independent protein translocase protein TatA